MKEKKNKRFSPYVRLIGFSCSLLLIGSLIYIASVGVSFLSGFFLATAVAGLTVPSVMSGDGILEILTGTGELIIEGIQTIFEIITEMITSFFS